MDPKGFIEPRVGSVVDVSTGIEGNASEGRAPLAHFGCCVRFVGCVMMLLLLCDYLQYFLLYSRY
jgi:hypothetical protein